MIAGEPMMRVSCSLRPAAGGRGVPTGAKVSVRARASARGGDQLLYAGERSSSVVGTPSVLIPVADGVEEMEAVIMCDTLRRAGYDVTMASCEPDELQVSASRNVQLVADSTIDDVSTSSFDAILLPGGMPGAERLGQCEVLLEMLKKQKDSNKLYGAICAAPAVVLEPNALLSGRLATCHPGFMDGLEEGSASEARVVLHDNCITSRGPGTAFEFALVCIAVLSGQKAAIEDVAGPMVLPTSVNVGKIADELGVE